MSVISFPEIQFVEEPKPAKMAREDMIQDLPSLPLECQRQRADEKISLAFHDTKQAFAEVNSTEQKPDDVSIKEIGTSLQGFMNMPSDASLAVEKSTLNGDSSSGQKLVGVLDKYLEGDIISKSNSQLTGQMLTNAISEEETCLHKEKYNNAESSGEELSKYQEGGSNCLTSDSRILEHRLLDGGQECETFYHKENFNEAECLNEESFSLNPQSIERHGCLEQDGQLGKRSQKSDVCLVSAKGTISITTEKSKDTLDHSSTTKSIQVDTYSNDDTKEQPCIGRETSTVISTNYSDKDKSTIMEQSNDSGEVVMEKLLGDADYGNRGELGAFNNEDLEQDHASALWIKWRGKWQTGILCPRVDCPLSTLRAKPTHERKKNIPVFFPRTKLYSWTDLLLVRPIDELPEPLAYGTHRKWRKMVMDLALPRRYVMQRLAVSMLNISDQLHTEAVTDDARKAATWKEFAMEASQSKDYSDLGRMLLKLQTMILPAYMSSDWLVNSFDSWRIKCQNAESAESIELLTEELMDSVIWLEVDELWNAPVQPELGPEWKTWKQEAMKLFFASHSNVASEDMEQRSCFSPVVVGDENNRKRPKLEIRRAENNTSKMEAPAISILSKLDSVKENTAHSNGDQHLACHSLHLDATSTVALAMEPGKLATGCVEVGAEAKDLRCALTPETIMQEHIAREKAALENGYSGVDYMKKYRKCAAFVPTKGRQCERWANDGEIYCCVHLNARSMEKLSQEEKKLPVEAPMCEGMTTHGRKCKHRARYGSAFCKKHCLQTSLDLVISDNSLNSSRNALMHSKDKNQVQQNISCSHTLPNELQQQQPVQSTHGKLIQVVVGETLDERNCLMKELELSNALPTVGTTLDVSCCIGQYSLTNREQCPEYAKKHTLYCEKHLPRFLKRARNGRSRLVSKDIFISLLKGCTSRKQKLYLHQACELLFGFIKRGLSRQKPVSRADIMSWILTESNKDPDLGEFLLKLVSSEREKLSNIWGFSAEKKFIPTIEIKTPLTSLVRKKYNEASVRCKICSEKFVDDKTLGMHWADVHKKEARWLFRGYACSVCMNSFTNKKVLETHVRERHGDQFLEHSIIFRCMSCNAHFVNTQQLWHHIFSFHTMDFKLQNHSQIPSNEAIVPKAEIASNISNDTSDNQDGSQKLVCRLCGLRFDLLPDLGRHHQVAHMNQSSTSLVPPKRSNHNIRRGRHSYPRFKKSLRASFRYDNHAINSSERHLKLTRSVLPVQEPQNQESELLGLGLLQKSQCSEVASTLFSKIQKTKPRPSNLEIFSLARLACCKISLLAELELKYGILPENAYLKALKLCSELSIQVNWHQEGFICPKGCKLLTSSHSLASLKPIPDGILVSRAFTVDHVNGGQLEMDESHFVLDQKHLHCQRKNKAVILCEDVSFGRERVSIPCVVDEFVMDYFQTSCDEVSSIQKLGTSMPWEGFHYVTERLIDPSLSLDTKNLQLGCSCGNLKCSPDRCDHVYLFENDFLDAEDIFGNPMRGRFAYDERCRVIVKQGYLVYECNSMCHCDKTCQNRVLQNGVQLKLEIFKTEKKGWAVRAGEAISRGTFVCEYIGEVLNKEEANKRGERYDADGCSYDIDAHIDGARSCIEGMTQYVIDATKYGNVSRFINHSCSPNLVNYLVLVESMECQLAHIGFYANRDIVVGEELCYEYHYKLLPGEGRPCYCGAPNCRSRLC